MPVPTLLTPKQIIYHEGQNYIVITSVSGAILTCGNQSYTLGSGETSHVFSVDTGTYTCTASKSDYYNATQSVTISTGQAFITLIPTYLPTTYQQVEYLRATGTQYIETSCQTAENQVINFKFRRTTLGEDRVFAASDSDGTPTIFFATSSKGYIAKNNCIDAGNVRSNPSINNNVIYDVTLNASTTLTINGSDYSNSLQYGGNTVPRNIYLFTQITNPAQNLQGDIFKFAITQSGTKALDLVPCYRKSDSVLGMWDRVSDTFLTNSGTGTFTAGPDVN